MQSTRRFLLPTSRLTLFALWTFSSRSEKETRPFHSFLAASKWLTASSIGRRELNHLKLLFDAGKTKWPAVYWNAAAKFPGEFTVGDTVDIVYRLSRNSYGGGENLQLIVLDLKK